MRRGRSRLASLASGLPWGGRHRHDVLPGGLGCWEGEGGRREGGREGGGRKVREGGKEGERKKGGGGRRKEGERQGIGHGGVSTQQIKRQEAKFTLPCTSPAHGSVPATLHVG